MAARNRPLSRKARRKRRLFIQRDFNPPLGGLPVKERESLRAVILRDALGEYNRLCAAGCDPDWLIIHLYYWAGGPAQRLENLFEERARTAKLSQECERLKREAERLKRNVERLDKEAIPVKGSRARTANLLAANLLSAEARIMSSFVPPRVREQDARGKADAHLLEWVRKSTKRHYFGTVEKLLGITSSHFNKDSSPTKASLQANVRRQRRVSARLASN
jgi:hypothetical protein